MNKLSEEIKAKGKISRANYRKRLYSRGQFPELNTETKIVHFHCATCIIEAMEELVMRGHFLSKSEIVRSALYFFLEHKQIINFDTSKVVVDKKGKIWKMKNE